MSRLDQLPIELVHSILDHLDPPDINSVARCCKKLRQASDDEAVWRLLINENLDEPLTSPRPARTFRELYLAHHPYWFLVKHKIWFADDKTPMGKLLCVRYVPRTGCIIGQQMVARRTGNSFRHWEKDPGVIIHEFTPTIRLNDDAPVIKIKLDNQRIPCFNARGSSGAADNAKMPPYHSREILMENFNDPGIFSSLVPALALPAAAIGAQTEVWPPFTFPALSRVRNASKDGYTGTGYRPETYSQLSQSTFRLRRWADYSGGQSRLSNGIGSLANIRLPPSVRQHLNNLGFHGTPHGLRGLPSHMQRPQDVHTYATLPPEAWRPTPQKPYQGIWCGDYSGHGCEFILITQPDAEDQRPLPEKLNWLLPWFAGQSRAASDVDESEEDGTPDDEGGGEFAAGPSLADLAAMLLARTMAREEPTPEDDALLGAAAAAAASSSSTQNHIEFPYIRSVEEMTDLEDVPSGRLEAIKLTGDMNVPRGELTFISLDIGHGGFIRVADEESFRGARLVRSAGHIAGDGFSHDQYTPSQLILISHDRLAQLWEGFNHVSYFERVDIDALTRFKDDWADEPTWMTS